MADKQKSFDDGHAYITFGWIATIIGFIVFGALANSYSTSEIRSSYYSKKCSEENKELPLSAPNIKTLPSNKEATHGNNQHEEKPNWCDLAAQDSMARSTVWVNRAAWATFIFTAVGVFLIGRTLVQTGSAAKFAAEALKEARKTTKQARKATRVAEESSKDQTRAYVFVEKAKFYWGNRDKTNPHVVLSVKNSGQSPAKWISVCSRLTVTRIPVKGFSVRIPSPDYREKSGFQTGRKFLDGLPWELVLVSLFLVARLLPTKKQH